MSIAQIAGRLGRAPATIKGYFYDPSYANKRPTDSPQVRQFWALAGHARTSICKRLLGSRCNGTRPAFPHYPICPTAAASGGASHLGHRGSLARKAIARRPGRAGRPPAVRERPDPRRARALAEATGTSRRFGSTWPHPGMVPPASFTLRASMKPFGQLVGSCARCMKRSAPFALPLLFVALASFSSGAEAATVGRLTSAADSAKFVSVLPLGAQIPPQEGPACPAVEIFRGTSECFVEYHFGNHWYLVNGYVTLQGGALAISELSTGSWVRRRTRCSLRGWHVPGVLTSNNACGRGGGESDAYFVGQEMWLDGHVVDLMPGWIFTDSAGFDSLGGFPCKHRRRTYVCTNAVGDSFSFTP